MKKRSRRLRVNLSIACIAIVCFFIGISQTFAKQRTLLFGVLPYLVPHHMAATYGPATLNLSQKTGLKIRFSTASNFSRFANNLRNQKYDLAIVQPFDVLSLVNKYNYHIIARVNEHLNTVFVVLDNSHINSIDDLKGKIIAMAPATAATSISALAYLRANKLTENDVLIKYLRSHDSCLQEVYNRLADACATGIPPVLAFEKRLNTKLKVIAKTPDYPHMALVVHNRVPVKERKLIQKIVTGWDQTEEGRKILQIMHFKGWVSATTQDYQILSSYTTNDFTVPYNETINSARTFAVFPYLPARKMAENFSALTLDFANMLQKSLTFHTTNSYMQFRRNLQNKLYSYALVQPFDYLLARDSGYIGLAELDMSISAAFYVATKSHVHSLKDLKGKIIALPPAEAAVSRLALNFLNSQKNSSIKDYKIIYRRSHDSCIHMVLARKAAACATAPILYNKIMKKELKGKVRKIFVTPSIPGLVFVAQKNIPEKERKNTQHYLLNLDKTKKGKNIIDKVKLSPFKLFNEADYRNLNIQ